MGIKGAANMLLLPLCLPVYSVEAFAKVLHHDVAANFSLRVFFFL
jgi:hypothetical protein